MDTRPTNQPAVPDYLALNLVHWNEKVRYHLFSDFYRLEAFKAGEDVLNDIEVQGLGSVEGKSLLHLQCHFGQDTLCWARRGARVTGVDFSPAALEAARALADELQLEARFVLSDLYSLPEVLDGQYDVVFASYGAVGWLPDLEQWAAVVRRFLAPGGVFFLAEFHPALMMLDDDFERIGYSYFNRGPLVFDVQGTYAQPDAPIRSSACMWNHSLADVIGALLRQGMQLEDFREYDYSPYNCFPNLVETEKGRYQHALYPGQFPMVYAVRAKG
jgi:ubiquinone/menaquinone biosynthesis C-methylase UbiE